MAYTIGFSLVLVVLVAAYVYAARRLGFDKGIHAVSTVATALATVVLSVFTWQQLRESDRRASYERRGNWIQLKNAMSDVLESLPDRGVATLMERSPDEQSAWFTMVRQTLDRQSGNPLLLDDEVSLRHWRNALATAQTAVAIIRATQGQERRSVETLAGRIYKDVGVVWDRIVLDSSEPSAVGGDLPSPKP